MITRAQMQRQLRNRGGVMTVKTIRKKYGLGDLVGDVGNFVRKLIPNELANVAVKAAPFVAPFNPLAAAAMRGIGRFDQRGSISDALKQGAGTFAFGYGARKLGGADGIGGFSMDSFSSPLSSERTQALSSLFDKQKAAEKFAKDKTGILPKSILEKTTMKIPGVRALPKIVQEQLLTGGITAGASLLASYFQGEFRPQEEGESIEDYLTARKEAVGTQMRTYMDNYFKFDKEYSTMTDAQRNQFVARYNVRDGGRIGFNEGTPQEMFPDNIDNIGPRKLAPRLRKMPEFKGNEVKPSDMMMAGPVLPPDPTQPVNPFGPKPGDFGIEEDIPIKMASNIENDKILEALFEKYIDMGLSPKDAAEAAQKEFDRMSMMKMKDRTMADKGGVMGIPVRMNSEGIKELDMRKSGGFVPIGVKEKADDVPAMLSKNEFVMTADAVRAAGGGSINKGAQRMYDTMKKLESRVA